MAFTDLAASALKGTVATRVARRAKWSWFGYGIAAYVGLRLARRYGIFAPQADRLINLMERGASAASGGMIPVRQNAAQDFAQNSAR